MKTSLRKTFALFLTMLLLATCYPVVNLSLASQSRDNAEAFAVETKNVTIQRTYQRYGYIPPTISYNKDGFTGTLRKHSRYDYVDVGKNTITYSYSGTVYRSSGGGIGPGGR